MEIKVAGKGDFERLEPVLIEVELHHVKLEPEVFHPITAYDRDHFNVLVENDSQVIFYVEDGGKVAGVLIAIERERPSNPMYLGGVFTEVEELSVSQNFRRQGVGKMLMKEAEEWTRSRGRKHIQLSVWVSNKGAVQFYEELGYVPKLIRYQREING